MRALFLGPSATVSPGMTDFMPWVSEYELGVSAMDGEHKELVRRMNELYELVRTNGDRQSIGRSLSALGTFTADHFAHEEAHMTAIGFDRLATHKMIHKQLLGQFAEHVEAHRKGEALGDPFFRFLKHWLAAHICGVDRRYAKVS